MDITQAIVEFQASAEQLKGADQAQHDAQVAFDAAQVTKATADTADVAAVAAFNSALDVLIAAANAAKVVRP